MTKGADRARAWLYCGQWVADCPAGCNNVELLIVPDGDSKPHRRLNSFVCSYCGYESDIEWAKNEDEIIKAVAQRPFAYNRNWFPSGHRLAEKANLPSGQSVADLMQENKDHGLGGDLEHGVD